MEDHHVCPLTLHLVYLWTLNLLLGAITIKLRNGKSRWKKLMNWHENVLKNPQLMVKIGMIRKCTGLRWTTLCDGTRYCSCHRDPEFTGRTISALSGKWGCCWPVNLETVDPRDVAFMPVVERCEHQHKTMEPETQEDRSPEQPTDTRGIQLDREVYFALRRKFVTHTQLPSQFWTPKTPQVIQRLGNNSSSEDWLGCEYLWVLKGFQMDYSLGKRN